MCKKKILAIGVDDYVLELISVLLSASGCEVLEVLNHDASVETVYAECPELVIVDVALPREGDLTFCKELKGDLKTRKIPLLVLETNHKEKAMWDEIGVDGFILKPFASPVLARQVMQLLALDFPSRFMVDRAESA